MTESVERVALEKMRADLIKERDDFLAQLEQLRKATAQTETAVQRADGALVVVEKVLADTVPQPEDAEHKPGGVVWVPDLPAGPAGTRWSDKDRCWVPDEQAAA